MADPRQHGITKALAATKELLKGLEWYDGSDDGHLALLRKLDLIGMALEDPVDLTVRWTYNIHSAAACNLASRAGVFEQLPDEGGINASDLSARCGLPKEILLTVMRMLLTNGICDQTGREEFAHNELSRHFRPRELGAHVRLFADLSRALFLLPQYIKSHGPDEIYDELKSPFAFAEGQEGKEYYEIINTNLEERDLWNRCMEQMAKEAPVLGLFSFDDLLEEANKQPERPFIVEIGGGRGHALLALQNHFGGRFKGKLILQDLPIVINSIHPDEISGVEPMIYDARTAQPVKNAMIYFMRRLIHDFHDKVASEMIRNTAKAMGPDSRLILSEMIIPEYVDIGANPRIYWQDLCMSIISGQERTLEGFQKLFDEAGLELVKVHWPDYGYSAMLEARLKR